MRTLEEICKEYSVINNNDEIELFDLISLIKDVRKEAWNEATMKAADEAELGLKSPGNETVYAVGKTCQINKVDILCVNKESILKNLKK